MEKYCRKACRLNGLMQEPRRNHALRPDQGPLALSLTELFTELGSQQNSICYWVSFLSCGAPMAVRYMLLTPWAHNIAVLLTKHHLTMPPHCAYCIPSCVPLWKEWPHTLESANDSLEANGVQLVAQSDFVELCIFSRVYNLPDVFVMRRTTQECCSSVEHPPRGVFCQHISVDWPLATSGGGKECDSPYRKAIMARPADTEKDIGCLAQLLPAGRRGSTFAQFFTKSSSIPGR